jgi:mRNA export factor
MYGTSSFGVTSGGTLFAPTAGAPAANYNPMKDIEVPSPPDDSVSALSFSPGTLPATYLAAASWDNNVRIAFLLHVSMLWFSSVL